MRLGLLTSLLLGGVLGALAAAAAPGRAAAQTQRETPLLEVDLRAGKSTRIDAPSGDAMDAELDAALGKAVGSSSASFSTTTLDRVEKKLEADVRRERPRATPQLIVFLYPGRVSADKLKTLSEVFVDIEIVIDPCDRTVCRDAVARHIELTGRAVGQPVQQTARYKLVFKTLILKTLTDFHGPEVEEWRVPIPEAVAAAGRHGGGAAWLDSRKKADLDYEPLTAKAIAHEAARRRVALAAPPSVSRAGGEADVALKVRGDRNRLQQQVLDAFGAAAAGLRANPATPPQTELEVTALVPEKGTTTRRFKTQGQPVGLWLDGQLGAGALWSTYVIEVKRDKNATTLAFGDEEAKGGGGPESEADDSEAIAVLAAHFAPLGACARAEAAKNRRFAGVTLTMRWLPSGVAEGVTPKEPGLRGGTLARCLAAAVAAIRLPRFSGAARTIEYPIRVKH